MTEGPTDLINMEKFFKGFSKLSYRARLEKLEALGLLSLESSEYLQHGGLKDIHLGEHFIENAIGYFQLPMGVATNFRVDGLDRIIPMAVEETSIIAAASKTARWVRESGEIKTRLIGKDIIGQIQIARCADFARLENFIVQNEARLVEVANRDVAHGLVRRGGGVTRLKLRKILRPDGLVMAVVHVYMNALDAMGANVMNQVCEYLKIPIQQETGESVTMCILSNLVDSRLTEAEVTIRNIEPGLASRIEEASFFGELDPYRAATNNKGVLNGIDPILIATGNDWRAVEAGIHAYAVKDGQYRSITQWRRKGNDLVGVLRAPLIVGTVGGVTTLHPTSKIAMSILGVQSAEELSRICAAVGLVQNLGALRALTTEGIIEGHMKLHIKNLSLGAGAKEEEMPALTRRLEEILQAQRRISLSHAVEVLSEIRAQSFQNSPLAGH